MRAGGGWLRGRRLARARLEPIRRAASRLLDVLVPCACLACGAIEPGSLPLGLCARCRARLEGVESPRRPACDLCGATLDTPLPHTRRRCIPCLQKNAPLDRLYCAWVYREPLDAVIHAFKFRDLAYLGAHLARELDRILPPALAVDAVVPVPLHWRRSWARGYNQAVEIARPLGRSRGWPLDNALVKHRATAPQSGLGRARRRRNLRRSFGLRRRRSGGQVAGKRLLLIDDVYTTGTTLEAAARCLWAGGAAWVGAAVAGRTPDPKDYKKFMLQTLTF